MQSARYEKHLEKRGKVVRRSRGEVLATCYPTDRDLSEQIGLPVIEERSTVGYNETE